MLSRYAHLNESLVFLLVLFHTAESGTCLKRQSVGYRENNVYECNHPVYSECCEHSYRFTCCEPSLSKDLRNQLQLWGLVAVVLAVAAMVYSCWSRDGELIQSETLKQAAVSLRYKFSRGKEQGEGEEEKKEKEEEKKEESSSDRTRLTTSFTTDGHRSSLPSHFHHHDV
ncbi:uncharacterized protein LOC143301543 [Babylonia areolata]|uniref:uncharacterized protein LOC143301543 n=1 Tax=Babylonia areolata TaxID=304850 RepID=UPI003FD5C601